MTDIDNATRQSAPDAQTSPLVGVRTELQHAPVQSDAGIQRPARMPPPEGEIQGRAFAIGGTSRGTVGDALAQMYAGSVVDPPAPAKPSVAGAGSLWTDAHRDTLVRLLVGDSEPVVQDADSLLAEYTRETGYYRTAGAIAGELRKIEKVRNLKFSDAIHKGLAKLATAQLAVVVRAGQPTTHGAPDQPTTSDVGWRPWEEKAVIDAAQHATTADAYLALLRERGSGRSPAAYVNRMRRMLTTAGVLTTAEAPCIEAMIVLVRAAIPRKLAAPAPVAATARTLVFGDDAQPADGEGPAARAALPTVGAVCDSDLPMHPDYRLEPSALSLPFYPLKTACPHCNAETGSGVFCGMCGKRYDGAIAPPPRHTLDSPPAEQRAREARETIPAPAERPPVEVWQVGKVRALADLWDDGLLDAAAALVAIRRVLAHRNTD